MLASAAPCIGVINIRPRISFKNNRPNESCLRRYITRDPLHDLLCNKTYYAFNTSLDYVRIHCRHTISTLHCLGRTSLMKAEVWQVYQINSLALTYMTQGTIYMVWIDIFVLLITSNYLIDSVRDSCFYIYFLFSS